MRMNMQKLALGGWAALEGLLLDGIIPRPCVQECRSPLFHSPHLMKRWLRINHLGAELSSALGRGEHHAPDRARALELAHQGASAWYERGVETGPTNLQVAVSLGWCDVAQVLLENDRHWFWRTAWGKQLKSLHLSSLWFCVDNDETETLLMQHAPLETATLWHLPYSALYRLAGGLGERGLMRSFSQVYARLPVQLREVLAENVDLRRWAMDSMLFMVRKHQWMLSRHEDDMRPLAHFLAAWTEGQGLLREMGAMPLPLDRHGNSALLTWCLMAHRWKPGPSSHASHGNPLNSQRYLPDSPEHAAATLQGLLALGVDPSHRNDAGATAMDQAALQADGLEMSLGLRGDFQAARRYRLSLLQSLLEARELATTVPAVAVSSPVRL